MALIEVERLSKAYLTLEKEAGVWGSFKGCPVVADGRVFAASRSGTLTALDAETGEVLWRDRHPYTESWATPTYAAGKLLVFRGNSAAPKGKEGGGIWCHDAQTGKLLWRWHTVPGNPANGFENPQMKMAAATWKGPPAPTRSRPSWRWSPA